MDKITLLKPETSRVWVVVSSFPQGLQGQGLPTASLAPLPSPVLLPPPFPHSI